MYGDNTDYSSGFRSNGDLHAEIRALWDRINKAEARVAEHEEEMELFTAAAVMICQQESDEWDSDRLQTYKDYAEVCGQRIAKLTPVNARAWLLRKQAEAVEALKDREKFPGTRGWPNAVEEITAYVQHLRQQADEIENKQE